MYRRFKRRKVTYNQRGYSGCSMSLNAVNAYENGERPMSKWNKAAILEQIADNYDNEIYSLSKKLLLKDLKKYYLSPTETHHTGLYATPTQFYEVFIYSDSEMVLNDLKKLLNR